MWAIKRALRRVRVMADTQRGGVVRLRCKVQHYEWGRVGEDSEVARLHALATGQEVDSGLPYAELWMGTHDSGPSTVLPQDGEPEIPLKDWLRQHPEALGDRVLERWDGNLPFLFKVLSVAKALSIQAHPDKKTAEELHRQQPKLYKDANHKPELALALTEFGALCGFVNPQELKRTLETVPELADVLGEEIAGGIMGERHAYLEESTKAALKSAFTRLMTLEQSLVADTLLKLTSRLTAKMSELSRKEELVIALDKQYPADVGVLAAFFLNYIVLSPGEAVYLPANEPHAYLYGDCIECMATSDNVVRAGLTPKFRDTQTLCSMLTYKQGLPSILQGHSVDRFTRRYSTPSDEFEVDHITVPVGETAKIGTDCGPSIFLVHDGLGVMSEVGQKSDIVAVLARGNIFLLVAGSQLEISALAELDDGKHPGKSLQLYRAGVSSLN